MAARRAPGALAALRRDLRRMPEELRDGVEAACAIELARSIDQGLAVVASTRQLAALMIQLRARALTIQAAKRPPAPPVESQKEASRVTQLAGWTAARRGAAAG